MLHFWVPRSPNTQQGMHATPERINSINHVNNNLIYAASTIFKKWVHQLMRERERVVWSTWWDHQVVHLMVKVGIFSFILHWPLPLFIHKTMNRICNCFHRRSNFCRVFWPFSTLSREKNMHSNAIDKQSMTWTTSGPLAFHPTFNTCFCRFGSWSGIIKSRNGWGNIQSSQGVWQLLVSIAMEVGSWLELVLHGMRGREGSNCIRWYRG